MSPNNMPPLLFNNVHGENVSISQNGAVAKRTNSFCKAIAFSDRPVKVAEKVRYSDNFLLFYTIKSKSQI